MTLSIPDLVRLESVSRLLLNPFVASDPDAWLAEAGGMVTELVGGDATLITPPVPAGTPHRNFSVEDEELGVQMHTLIREVTASGLTFIDPVIEAWYRARAHHEVSSRASNRRVVEPLGYRLEDSIYVSEIASPLGYHDWVAMHEHTQVGDAAFVVFAKQGRSLRFGESVHDVLQTLMPSFRSGLDTFGRFGAQRAALDAVLEPLAVFSAGGVELYRNRALSEVIAADPERATLQRHVERLGRAARGFVGPLTGAPPAGSEEVRTARGRYTLRSSALPPGLFGPDPAAMVTLSADTAPKRPDVEAVRTRLGLTRRESEVALLLADGLSNADLADRLFVSAHTARHHVENVLAKLNLSSRAAVARRLVEAA